MKKAMLVFIPLPRTGHLEATVEIAKLLVDRDQNLSITVLIMKPPFESMVSIYTQSLAATSPSPRIRFVNLPLDHTNSEVTFTKFITTFIEDQKPHVKKAVKGLTGHDAPTLVGFVIDMFCTNMIDVANEFGVPTYLYSTSGAASLGLMFHLQTLYDEHNKDVTELEQLDTQLVLPGFVNPVPAKVLPPSGSQKDSVIAILAHVKRFRETKGIMVNTFMELESHALDSLSNATTTIPPVYTVGPVLNLKGAGSGGTQQRAEIMVWLDDQPPSSVVFLCFGSMGSFGVDQVGEISRALERSGHRFLWSLRQRPPEGKCAPPTDYTNYDDILPRGFLERTAGIGKVIGWAPQVDVLAHPAIGGFVSHCGWNSVLESLWFGVPIATWPMYAEQQLNAFQLVREFGLAEEIRLDYKKGVSSDSEIIVSAEEIEEGIRRVMKSDSEVRKKVTGMKDKSRNALMEGGSSYNCLERFIEDMRVNMALSDH